GEQAVVFTTNDSAYAAAIDLHDAGVRINAIVDARPEAPARWAQECEARNIPLRTDSVISGTLGEARITHAMARRRSDDGDVVPLACDVLLVSGGWNPAVHLFSQARGKLRYDDSLGAFVPGEQLDRVSVDGSAHGIFDLPGCLRDGREAGATAVAELGFTAPSDSLAG